MSYLLLYGENLKLYNSTAISAAPYNIAYSDVIAANSSIWTTYKNGFIPNTGASGVMLNTVLKQSSYAANVMQNTYRNLFNADIYDAPLSVQTQLEQNITTIVNYVGQIQTLLNNNTIIPNLSEFAVNYRINSTTKKNIVTGFTDIENTMQWANNSGTPTIFNTARNYTAASSSGLPSNLSSISEMFTNVSNSISQTNQLLLELFTQSTYIIS